MVNVGIKSVPGNNSSAKLNIAPKAAFLPNTIKNIIAEMGAQITSTISPNPGTRKELHPIKSISTQKAREGCFFIV